MTRSTPLNFLQIICLNLYIKNKILRFRRKHGETWSKTALIAEKRVVICTRFAHSKAKKVAFQRHFSCVFGCPIRGGGGPPHDSRPGGRRYIPDLTNSFLTLQIQAV